MPVASLSKSAVNSVKWLRETSAGRILLIGVAIGSFVIGWMYHMMVHNAGQHFPLPIYILYHTVVVIGYGSMWLLLSSYLPYRKTSPTRIFWSTLLIGILYVVVASGLMDIGRSIVAEDDFNELAFDLDTGAPLVVLTVVKMNVLGFLTALFAFYLLLRMRDLVLFKRTKSSLRNWHLMLGAMALTSVSFYTVEPHLYEWSVLQILLVVAAIGFMVINALRISWIVYLPFKEKMISLGLSLLLLIFPLIGVGGLQITAANFEDLHTYMIHYSPVLSVFALLSLGFGFLYCTASFLMIFFHLPTTGEFQQRSNERAVMQSLTDLVNQSFDPVNLHATIAASPVEAGSAQMAWLALADPQSGSLRPSIVATNGISPGRVERLVDTSALYEEVASTRAPLVLDQAPADHRLNVRPGDGFSSLLALPLIARDQVLGSLIVTKEVSHGFERDDIETINTFAAQAALALDNARLFEEQLEKERLARELDIAREVQRKLLPQRVPQMQGVTIAAANVSAEKVGGDYYDFMELDENRLCMIIGDVSGKGASAAFYMAEMQGIFQSVSRITPDPTSFLSHANAALADSLDSNVFISAIYGVLDINKEQLVLARAGHCPIATIDLNGQARYIRSSGLGLGLDRTCLFEQTLEELSITLQPGDVFVMYTDGVVESRDESGEEYGYDRLLDSLRAHRHEDAADLHSALLSDLHRFLGQETYDDDMTLVVLKWHGVDLQINAVNENRHQHTSAQLSPALKENLSAS